MKRSPRTGISVNTVLALKTLAWFASIGENKCRHTEEVMTKVIHVI